MAAIRQNLLSRLRLSLMVGQKDDGSPILRTRTYNRINDQISDNDVLAVAQALSTLHRDPIMGIVRLDEAVVMPE